MSPTEITIKELKALLISELYKFYRENPEINVRAEIFLNRLKETYKEKHKITENDFIIAVKYLESNGCIKSFGPHGSQMPKELQITPKIIDYLEISENAFNSSAKSYEKTTEPMLTKFIKISFKDYQLPEYESFIDLINKCAYPNDFYRFLPYLLRLLFEKLLYDIFLTSLHNKHKYFYYLNRPRDFSQHIALLNVLKDIEYKPFHTGSINQEIISLLKEIQRKGNLTVHQIIRQIDKKFIEEWDEKVDRILINLLKLYKDSKDANIIIQNEERLEKIYKILNPGLKPSPAKEFKIEEVPKILKMLKI